MLRSRFLWKLYAGYVVLILMTALVVGLLQHRQIGEDARAETRGLLLTHAHMLRELALPVLRSGTFDPKFQERLEHLGRNTGSRLTVILNDGTVLADSNGDPQLMNDHSARPEVLAARTSRRAATSERFSDTLDMHMVYTALPVDEGPRPLGFARTARGRNALSDYIARLRTNMALGVLLVSILGCVVGLIFARGLTRRLSAMTEVAQAMAAGQHHRRVEPMGQDEVATLARAVNAMAEELARRLQTSTKERAELLAILEGMVEGVIAVDRDQNVVLINDEARRMLSIGQDAVTGRPVRELTRLRTLSDAIDLVLGGARNTENEIVLSVGGEDRHVALLSTPLRDDREDVAGAVVVLHDMTDVRRLESIRRDFVTNVSHELKTPLTSIHGFVETLIDDPTATPETRERFLGKILSHSQRLSALVSDLLTLARVESADQRQDRGTLDLREAVRTSAGLLSQRAEDKGLEFRSDLPDRAILVQGDIETLRQLVDNLLDNAIKYTPAGGNIRLGLSEQGHHAVLEVQDSGVGLAPSHRERIFERFYRVDRARSRELGGTGLGLSIVKHVALSHGGQVSVESTLGAGSTFRVTLPLVS